MGVNVWCYLLSVYPSEWQTTRETILWCGPKEPGFASVQHSEVSCHASQQAVRRPTAVRRRT